MQIAGWYNAGRGRRLIILPENDKLIAVIDWGNAAPCSVGEIRNEGDSFFFWQPADKVNLKVGRQHHPPGISSISLPYDLDFTKQIGFSDVVGQFASEKHHVMTISNRDGGLYCSIDWGNNAPLTNGFLRAAPDGSTLLQGFKWQEQFSLDVVDGLLKALGVGNENFARLAEQPPIKNAEPSDEPKSR
jgi:hypothetical protein